MKEKFKKAFLAIKITVNNNKLRTGALLCLLVVLLSFFMPFMSARIGLSVSGIGDNQVDVISPNYDVIDLNLGDFVLQKPIDDLTFYGLRLGDAKVFDQSILELLRKPIPQSGLITNINTALSNPGLDFIIDPRLAQVIETNLEYGETINSLLKDSYNVLQGARRISGTINTASLQVQDTMDQVNAGMATIDAYKSQANGLIFTIFFLIIVLMALITYKRANIGLSIFISGLLSFLFISVGLAVRIVNSQINELLGQFTAQINAQILEVLRSILTGTLGDLGSFMASFIGESANFLFMSLFIQLNFGYWLIVLGLLATFILLITSAKQDRNIEGQSMLLIQKDGEVK